MVPDTTIGLFRGDLKLQGPRGAGTGLRTGEQGKP